MSTDAGLAQDHPRACGEQDQAARQPQIRRGSSPRVRGAGNQRAELVE